MSVLPLKGHGNPDGMNGILTPNFHAFIVGDVYFGPAWGNIFISHLQGDFIIRT